MHRQDVGCLLRGRIFAETIRRLRFLITVGYKKSGFVSRPPGILTGYPSKKDFLETGHKDI